MDSQGTCPYYIYCKTKTKKHYSKLYNKGKLMWLHIILLYIIIILLYYMLVHDDNQWKAERTKRGVCIEVGFRPMSNYPPSTSRPKSLKSPNPSSPTAHLILKSKTTSRLPGQSSRESHKGLAFLSPTT